MQSKILASLQLLGFKLVASFDISVCPDRHIVAFDTWVLRRIGPARESGPLGEDREPSPPSYDDGKPEDDSKESTYCLARALTADK